MQIVDFFIPNVMKVVTVTSDKANVNQISGQAVLEMRVAISDWVKAKTKNGELIHGFVETVDAEQKLVTLFVFNRTMTNRSANQLSCVNSGSESCRRTRWRMPSQLKA